MSQSLQRVIVRMLIDPLFVRSVFDGGELPELSESERGWIRATDPRAFGTDRYRRGRLLQALIEEYPTAVALAAGGRDLARVDAFLSSPEFHRCIQHRGTVALAFGEWLAAGSGDVARLEHAIAIARRRTAAAGEGLSVATGAWPVALSEGTVASWQQIRGLLGDDPLRALVAGIELPPLAPPATDREYLLLTSGGTALHWLAEGIYALLDRARDRTARTEVVQVALDLGLSAPEADEVIDELLVDGWLCR